MEISHDRGTMGRRCLGTRCQQSVTSVRNPFEVDAGVGVVVAKPVLATEVLLFGLLSSALASVAVISNSLWKSYE